MAIKKVYYYKVGIENKITGNIENTDLKESFENMFNTYRISGKIGPIILNEGELVGGQRIDRVTMDIIYNSEDYLFARVSKSKDNKDNLIAELSS